MKDIALILFALALAIRLIAVQLWTIPRLIYIPIILGLLIAALIKERSRLRSFFVRFDKIRSDLLWGLGITIAWYGSEWLFNGVRHGTFIHYRLDSLLLVPIGVLLAGWRAGIYEELMFRALGMGYLNLTLKRPWLSALLQAVIFCLAHVAKDGWLGCFGSGPFARIVWALLLGIVTLRRQSVIPAMVVHSIGNTFGAATLPPSEMIQRAIQSWW